MKNAVFLFSFLLICAAFTGCDKAGSDEVVTQDILLSGYCINEDGSREPDVFRFLFFPQTFSHVTRQEGNLCDTYEEYIQLEEDGLYKDLMDKNEPHIIGRYEYLSVPFVFIDDQTVQGKPMRVKLPVGRYEVFAFKHERGEDKKIWNKYGCASNLVITKGREPQIVKCLIPVDYTFIGRSIGTDSSLIGREDWISEKYKI